MIVSDLDYIENVSSAPIKGGVKIGFVFNTFINQEAFASSSASSDDGDATATAIAKNESEFMVNGVPVFST